MIRSGSGFARTISGEWINISRITVFQVRGKEDLLGFWISVTVDGIDFTISEHKTLENAQDALDWMLAGKASTELKEWAEAQEQLDRL